MKNKIKKIWSKIKRYLENKGWIKIIAPIIILMFAIVVLPHIAGAVETGDSISSTINDFKNQLVAMIVIFHAFAQALLAPLIMIASALMDNSILLDPAMESKLLEIWVEIRNWVNIIFVLVLVFIALYNVLGVAGDGSNYALKSILPKIVIGLIAVNFSFLACKLLIDSVGVVTNAVYALPTQFVNWEKHKAELKIRLCSNYEKNASYDASMTFDANNPNTLEIVVTSKRTVKDASIMGVVFCEAETSGDPKMLKGTFNDYGETYFNQFGQHNATAAIMINMGLINDADFLMLEEANDAKSGADIIGKMTLHALFGLFMFILFGFAFAALVCVLVARLIILWICLALSPIIVLFFVFPDLASSAGGEVDLKDKFQKHLFVPLVIGIVLSIGFTMLSVLYNSDSGSWLNTFGNDDSDSSSANYLEFDDLIVNMGDSDDLNEMVSTFGKDASDFQDLLIAISAVLIIWIGVFAAADQTVANTITGKIKDAGKQLGSFAAKMPLYLTTIPVPGIEGGASLGGILKSPFEMMNRFESKERSDASRVADLAIGDSAIGKKYKEASSDIENGNNPNDRWKTLQERVLNFDGALTQKDPLLTELGHVDSNLKSAFESRMDGRSYSNESEVKEALAEAANAQRLDTSGKNKWDSTPIPSSASSSASSATGASSTTTPTTPPSPLQTALSGVAGRAASKPEAVAAISTALTTAGSDKGAIQNNEDLKQFFGGVVSEQAATAVQQFNTLNTEKKTQVVSELQIQNGHTDGGTFLQAVQLVNPTSTTTASASTTTPATGTPGGTGQGTNPDATTPDPTTPLEADDDEDEHDNT